MDCPSRQEILEAVNGTGTVSGVQDHLAACATCRAVYDGMMAATEVLSTTPYAAAGAGRCLSDSQLIAYARRSAPAGVALPATRPFGSSGPPIVPSAR